MKNPHTNNINTLNMLIIMYKYINKPMMMISQIYKCCYNSQAIDFKNPLLKLINLKS